MVGEGGTAGLCRQEAGVDRSRWRGRQWPSVLALEVRAATAGRRIWSDAYGDPSPNERLQMEPDRAQTLLSSRTELGGTALGKLRDHAEIHSHHPDGNRVAVSGLPRPHRVRNRPEAHRRPESAD